MVSAVLLFIKTGDRNSCIFFPLSFLNWFCPALEIIIVCRPEIWALIWWQEYTAVATSCFLPNSPHSCISLKHMTTPYLRLKFGQCSSAHVPPLMPRGGHTVLILSPTDTKVLFNIIVTQILHDRFSNQKHFFDFHSKLHL